MKQKNTLLSQKEYGHIKLQNEHYKIKIIYAGDYKEDRENNKINTRYITLSCHCRDNSIMISKNRDGIYVNLNKSLLPDIYNDGELNEIVKDLQNAITTVNELNSIMAKYF